jgi:hypothetical protein
MGGRQGVSTDIHTENDIGPPLPQEWAADKPLPTSVVITQAFAARIPSQRVLDEVARIEQVPFNQVIENMPMRLLAFRALLRDFPGRDATSLWLHSYDVEVEITEADPTSLLGLTTLPPSVGTTE